MAASGGIGRYNKVEVTLIPNPMYILTASAKQEKSLELIQLTPHQIKKVEIIKSYETHLTEVWIDFTYMDSTAVARISDGSYLVALYIGAEAITGGRERFNFFVCDIIKPTGIAEVYGNFPAIEARGKFSSITKNRLEIENAFPFELGGKGAAAGKPAIGASENPYSFFNNEFKKLYYELYAERETESENASVISTKFTVADEDTLVKSSPSSGYLINANNNMETLEYLREHYPMYKTVYTWILDDFSSLPGYAPSTYFITDLIRWDSWKSSVDTEFSRFFNKNDAKAEEITGAAVLMGVKQTDFKPFYNRYRYRVRDDDPKIYATDIASGAPILMSAWNTLHANKYMMVQTATGYAIKKMTNPINVEYLTFMTPEEIEEVQTYKKVFENLHPSLATYSFTNLFFGNVDLNTVVKIDKASLDDEENYGFDRYGLCYQIKMVFEQTPIQPSGVKNQMKMTTNPADWLDDPALTPQFIMSAEATFLFIDEGAKTIREYKNLDIPQIDRMYEVDYYDLMNMAVMDPCDIASDDGGDGRGIPGNRSIVDQGRHLVDNGFTYVWGGTSDKGMDCSAFTQKAVTRAEANQGYPAYPRVTTDQYNWCRKYAIPIDPKHAQPGDIIFFRTKRCKVCHTGIISGGGNVLEASSTRGKGVEKPIGNRHITAIFRIVPKDIREGRTVKPPENPQLPPNVG